MLLIHDREPQPGQRDLFLKQRVRANGEMRIAALDRSQRFFSLPGGQASRQPRHFHRQAFEPDRELAVMLFGENFRGRHKGDLVAGFDRLQRCKCGDDRLAAAHVALQQSLHRLGAREIAADFGAHALLRTRQPERQTFEQRPRQRGISRQTRR